MPDEEAPCALAQAAYTGDLVALTQLLDAGADVNARSGEALSCAAVAGQEAAVDNSGADNNPLFAGSSSPATKLNFKPAGPK